MDQKAMAALGGILVCVIIAVLLVLVVAITIAVFYFLTLQKALSRVSPHNRLMEPAMVWLGLIPLFGTVWAFFIAINVPGSLKKEFEERNRDDGSDYGKGIALTYAILSVVSIPISLVGIFLPPEAAMIPSLINNVIGLVSLILFILFWVKIHGYSKQLASDDDDRKRNFDRRFDDDDDGYGKGDDHDKPREPSSEGIKEGDTGRYQ